MQAESVDVLRRRARHRLIGATVLVLAAVIGFPLLFDTQPRPVSVDVPISIPDRQKTKPLTLPATPAAPSGTASPAAAPAPIGAAAGLGPNEEVVATRPAGTKPAPAAPKTENPPAPKAEARSEPKPEPKTEAQAKPALQADDSAKARALLDGKDGKDADVADADRVVVQVGAFSDATKAREARAKLERAGLKTYTQVVETKDGKRVRVRVGPFANKAEADKAASKIKKLDLPAAILTL